MKLILSIIAVLLFSTSFWICKYITSDVDLNTDLRYSGYAIFCLFCFAIAQIKKDKYSLYTRFVLEVGIGLSISDIVDRFVFDITTYQKNDAIMLLVTIVIATYNYIYKKHNGNTESGHSK